MYRVAEQTVNLCKSSRINWTASSEFGTYRICEQRRFRRACACAQSRQNLRCSLIQAVSQDPWPLWMAGHAQLKLVVTECSKTQIRLTRLIFVSRTVYVDINSLYEPRHEKTCLCHLRTTKAQNSLISTFVVRFLESIIPLFFKSKISRL